MPEPTVKSQPIEELLTKLSGSDRKICITNSICSFCGGSASEFRDALSFREYKISGFCQQCQDDTFGE